MTEKQTLKKIQVLGLYQKLSARVETFKRMRTAQPLTYLRTVVSAPAREVNVKDTFTGGSRSMLMFASNNYLGLANHPHVKNRVQKAMEEFGCGVGGPPLLNGYTSLILETEERLAALKEQQSVMIFSSGFLANLGAVSALTKQNDIIFYDELSHASFYDALKLTKAKALMFPHNSTTELEILLQKYWNMVAGNIFVCVEGVYSMDGNLSRLDIIVSLCKKYGAILIVDDAHGTGVLGEKGSGTASHFQCSRDIQITMGTFSKVFATCGGFLAASADLIDYLRFHARSYIFSASVPPPVAAAVLGGLEVMEKEPWLRLQLLDNVKYAIGKLRPFGFCAEPEAAILTLLLPEQMDIRKAAYLFHQKNIFINSVEYPAVPANSPRFRISLMATHTKQDIDKLAEAVEEVWNDTSVYSE